VTQDESSSPATALPDDSIAIEPVAGPVHASIRPPGSKSITNRALICAALADGTSVLHGALDSDDTRVMIDSLQKLGVTINADFPNGRLMVTGTGGQFQSPTEDLFIGNSGTTVRFLSAALAFSGGNYRLDGVQRMRERPIGPLVDALNGIGGNVTAQSPHQCPPVTINNPPIAGGSVSVSGNISSQYLSGLLMAAPLSTGDVEFKIEGTLISQPYVYMTIAVMKSFGVTVEFDDALTHFVIRGDQHYRPCDYAIEPDASAASYFFAVAAICGGTATVQGLHRDSLQGDVGFVDCLQKMGCQVVFHQDSIEVTGPAIRGIDVDMSDVSDTVQTLTSVALFVDGPTHVRNVAHNRVKETDRIGNLAIELRKFGNRVQEREDGLSVYPEVIPASDPNHRPALAIIETYDDHRMAMSLSLVGLRRPGVVITNPGCVAKTYPNYFEEMKKFVG
jgi:3-phosphoshikimate 1-carboxyvinyltransferase